MNECSVNKEQTEERGEVDRTDERILDLLKGNARMSWKELGDAVGMSRTAAKKRVEKLEREGIIRGYNTCVCRPGEVTAFIDIVTAPEGFDEVLDYLIRHTAFVRQIFRTTKENHLHLVAVSDSVSDLKYLVRMITLKCGSQITEIHCHAAREVIKDVYSRGRIRNEQHKDESAACADHELDRGSGAEGEKKRAVPLPDVPKSADECGDN